MTLITKMIPNKAFQSKKNTKKKQLFLFGKSKFQLRKSEFSVKNIKQRMNW